MPCYSKIQTVLIELATIEKAAKVLSIEVIKRTPNRFTIRKGSDQFEIQREREGEKFSASGLTWNATSEILEPLVMGYAKERTKAALAKNGYTMSQGAKPNEFVFTSYR